MLFLLSLLSLSSALPVQNAADCPFPNGTDKALHYFMCAQNEQFDVNSINVTDKNGDAIYPFDPKQENILYLYTFNHGDTIYDNKDHVKLFSYTTGWTNSNKCAWDEIPTYGLLNNIDGCSFAGNCPLYPGSNVLVLPLDLSQFSVIINAIAAYKPYQLEIRVTNANPGNSKHEELACVIVQMELI